ncbi:SagB/ThcOx family dehydrogenase [Streptomyces lavendulocolor]|uniref:SagB/ThcOx family dehydrogenase n=1 Tax=Streptomyces lavendulocolor TaxID=67316 RepID=UPI003C2C534D
MSAAQERAADEAPPTEWYVQAALGFHRHSTYGDFPEPTPAGLLPSAGTPEEGTDEGPAGCGGSRARGGPEELVRLTAGRRSRRTRAERVSERSLARALAAALVPEPSTGRRPYPSAGGCYAVSVHVLVQDVEGLAPGVYAWDSRSGALTAREGAGAADADVAGVLRTTVIRPAEVQAVLLLTADMEVYGARYGERGYRYALLEAGHMGQNLTLALHLLGVANCAVGGFRDDHVSRLLHPEQPLRLPVYGVVLP